MSFQQLLEVPMMAYAVLKAIGSLAAKKILAYGEKPKDEHDDPNKLHTLADVAVMLKSTVTQTRALCHMCGLYKWRSDETFTVEELLKLKDYIEETGWIGDIKRTVTNMAHVLDVEPVVLMAALKHGGFTKLSSEELVTEEEYAAVKAFALLIQKDRATQKETKWTYTRQDQGYYQQPTYRAYVDPKIKAAQELLGVTDASTEDEITKAFRRKAFKAHPDHNPDGLALMIELDAARKLLLAKFK